MICYCTGLVMREVADAKARREWPITGHAKAGKLCTGCLGDLQWLMRQT